MTYATTALSVPLPLTRWQMLAIVTALGEAIKAGTVNPEGGRVLLDQLATSPTVLVTHKGIEL